MKNLLTAKLLLLVCLLVFTNCSKDDDTAIPHPLSPESLFPSKWQWVSWGNTTGDEIQMDPQKPVYMHFIDDSKIARITTDGNGQTKTIEFPYQISKDTLIAYETTQINYFKIKEQTSEDLTLNMVKSEDINTGEVTTQSGIFKYKKVAK